MLFLSLQPKVAQEAAGDAVTAIIGQGVLGALLILAVAVAIWAVAKLSTVQTRRVSDQKEMSDKLEKAQTISTELVREMIQAYGKNTSALDQLSHSEREHSGRLGELSNKIERLDRTVEISLKTGPSRSYTPNSQHRPGGT